MTISHSRRSRLLAAFILGTALSALMAGGALAHPESEGAHPGGCVVTVTPASVGVGGQFTVAGNFGGASLFLVQGAGASPTEDAQPVATTPAGQSFSVTFTAESTDVGTWTVWGLIEGSECGDADDLTVTTLPNTAVPTSEPMGVLAAMAMVVAGAGIAMRRLVRR
jgi:hypothetical protein